MKRRITVHTTHTMYPFAITGVETWDMDVDNTFVAYDDSKAKVASIAKVYAVFDPEQKK